MSPVATSLHKEGLEVLQKLLYSFHSFFFVFISLIFVNLFLKYDIMVSKSLDEIIQTFWTFKLP